MGFVWLPREHGRSPGPRVAAVKAWPFPWASGIRRWIVAGTLGLVPPPGRGRSPGLRVGAVGAWPAPWALCGHGGVAGPLGLVWPLWDVASPLDLMWPLGNRDRSPGLRVAWLLATLTSSVINRVSLVFSSEEVLLPVGYVA